jgi:hypothetical protein
MIVTFGPFGYRCRSAGFTDVPTTSAGIHMRVTALRVRGEDSQDERESYDGSGQEIGAVGHSVTTS